MKTLFKDWYTPLSEVINSPEFQNLGEFIAQRRELVKVYPERDKVFRAFQETSFNDVRVILLAMDPYNDGSAQGLAFSNSVDAMRMSPSLRFIFQEIEEDIYDGMLLDKNPDLSRWAKQGVLLLNSALTVEEKKAGSHMKEWKFFTTHVFKALNEWKTGLIFLFWGNDAKEYKQYINSERHYILEAGHPASHCYGKGSFLGCKHFSKVNEIITKQNGEEYKIIW
jgi:uracil-DNA glycosylase